MMLILSGFLLYFIALEFSYLSRHCGNILYCSPCCLSAADLLSGKAQLYISIFFAE